MTRGRARRSRRGATGWTRVRTSSSPRRWPRATRSGSSSRDRFVAEVTGVTPGSMIRQRLLCGAGALALLALGLSGCGGGAGAESTPTLHWYTAPQNGGSFASAAAQCTKQAKGEYRIVVEPLPADASQQREQLVRRLAAEDSGIDLMSMDVLWNAEFGEGGWVRAWPEARAAEVEQGKIAAVLKTG